MNEAEDDIIEDIMKANKDHIKKLLSSLNEDYLKNNESEELEKELIRIAFVVLLKITGKIKNWTTNEKDVKKLIPLWNAASKIRKSFRKTRDKALASKSPENVNNILKAMVEDARRKADVLLKFRAVNIEEPTNKLIFIELDNEEECKSDSNIIKKCLQHRIVGKRMQVPIHRESYDDSLFSPIIKLLKDDITPVQMIARFENYYLKAVVLCNVMDITQQSLKDVYSKKIRIDILAWIMSILNRASSIPWHYSQSINCGTSYQAALRDGLFGIIKQVLEYISLTKDSQELHCLVDALKWNYGITDHSELVNCKLFEVLRGKAKNEYISTSWGLPLDSKNSVPSYLVSAFEFVVIRVITQMIEDSSSESSTVKLVRTILDTIFAEIKSAVDSYEVSEGLESALISDYIKFSKEDKKPKDTDSEKKKVIKNFKCKSESLYSHEFCAKLLNLLYKLSVFIQKNLKICETISALIDVENMYQLLRLLKVGSIQHQFLILQIIPLMAKYSKDKLDQAAGKMVKTRFTESASLDFLLNFIVQRREGIWIPEVKIYQGGYSITKCAITTTQLLINFCETIKTAFWSLFNTIMFGSQKDWESMNEECKNRRLIETILSVAGAEASSLFKGARVTAFGKKGFVIAAFTNVKDSLNEWEFLPKNCTKAKVHLTGDEASIGEVSLIEVNISELIPKRQSMNLLIPFKIEAIQKLLKQAIENPLSDNLILATIQVKTIRILQLLLKKHKELYKQILNPDFITDLLNRALEKPKSPFNRSLKTTEMLLEDIRKVVSQSEGKALGAPDSSLITIKVLKNELLLSLRTGSLSLPLIAHKNTEKLRGKVFEYCKYVENLLIGRISNRVVFLSEEFESKLTEIEKCAKLLVITTPLDKFKDLAISMVQISKESMEALSSYEKTLFDIGKFTQENTVDKVVAEYLNVKADIKIDTTNIKDVVMRLLGEKGEEEKVVAEIKEVRNIRPLRMFTHQCFKCDKMIKERQNLKITSEIEELRKAFDKSYSQTYERTEHATPEIYSTTLSDLKLFYIRQLVLDYFNEEECTYNINFLLIMSIEADYLLYGFGYKKLLKKVKKLLYKNTKTNSLDAFVQWLSGRVHKMKEITKSSLSLFENSSETLESGVYVGFLYKYVHAFLKKEPKKLLKHPEIASILTNILTLVPIIENNYDKYRCLLLIKEIILHAQKLQHELSIIDLNRILANKAMRALSTYCREGETSTSILWRLMVETVLHATKLSKMAYENFDGEVVTYCISDNERLNTNIEIMRDFPDMTKLLTYSWIRIFIKQLKAKTELRLDTPRPLYDTRYCLLIENPVIQSIATNSKKKSSEIGMISFDKEMKARLAALDKPEEKFAIDLNRFYLHFPVNGYALYGFGSNEGGRIGLRDVKTTFEPKILPNAGLNKIVAIFSAGSHSFVIDKSDNFYTTGEGDGRIGLESNTFSEYSKRATSTICATNQISSIFFNPDENNLYITGKNPNKMFIVPSSNCNEDVLKSIARDLRQLAISNNHLLMLYGDKKLYASPETKKELFGSWVEFNGSKFGLLKLNPKILKITRIVAINCGSILLCDTETRKGVLYSFGIPAPGLGQGTNPQTDEYTPLLNEENIEFTELVGCENMAAAITKKGELYTWGKTHKGALGLYSSDGTALEESNVPKKVALPEKAFVLSVAVGFNHMLVLTEDDNKRLIYGFGDNTKNQLGEKDVNVNTSVITFFENRIPYLIAAGHSCSFVACGEKYNGIVHYNKCSIHKTLIKDILYLNRTKESIKYFCKDCIENLPEITIAIRNPIKKIEDKPLPVLDSLEKKNIDKAECTSCKIKIEEGPVYQSAVSEVKAILCEKCYSKTPSTFVPSVYYRITTVKTYLETELPLLSLSDLYETNNEYLSLIFTLKYKLYLPETHIEKNIKPSLSEFLEESKRFNRNSDLSIVSLLNTYLMEEGKEVDKLSLKGDINLPYNRKAMLSDYTEETLKRRAKVLIKFNKIIYKMLQCADFETKPVSSEDLYRQYAKVKEYLVTKVKDQIFKKVISNVPKVKGRTVCVVDNNKAEREGRRMSFFEQMWSYLKDNVRQFNKLPNKDKLPFKLVYRGKEELDLKILFDHLLVGFNRDICSNALPLLIPTANNKNLYGDYRDKWTLNPSITQPKYISMLEFLGALIGLCLRLNLLMPLKLTSMFWKQLIGDVVNRIDLKQMDAYCVECLEEIEKIDEKEVDPHTFESVVGSSFVTRLTDNSEVELKTNGKSIKVTFENRKEYIQLVEEARLKESLIQIEAVRTGLFKVMPEFLLKLYSWHEIEDKLCGKTEVSISFLKGLTKYINCAEDDKHIQYFWNALNQFTDEERSLYVRFAWGKSRLPQTQRKWNHKICVKECANPDDTLPETDPWYSFIITNSEFLLKLPRYTSLEKAKEKLVSAIKSSSFMNDDNNAMNNN